MSARHTAQHEAVCYFYVLRREHAAMRAKACEKGVAFMSACCPCTLVVHTYNQVPNAAETLRLYIVMKHNSTTPKKYPYAGPSPARVLS